LILYDEFGGLLGADTDSIELFGYSNITEFKEEVSDIADFFVNKDGYIHKFDHYSWIDFLNFSEEKLDKVLIKQEDNNAIEAKIIVKEIYNLIEINDSKITYMIDFINQNIIPVDIGNLEELQEKNTKDIQNAMGAEKTDYQKKEIKILDQNLLDNKIELDYDGMQEEFDVDKGLYQELLNDFILEGKNDLDLMGAYMINSNYELLLKTTKKLNSICTNLKLNVFLPILNSMERNIRNKSYDNIEKSLNVYKQELQILFNNIRQI